MVSKPTYTFERAGEVPSRCGEGTKRASSDHAHGKAFRSLHESAMEAHVLVERIDKQCMTETDTNISLDRLQTFVLAAEALTPVVSHLC